MPRRLFVVLTLARTGSSWLVDLLNSHPQVVAYGELFALHGREENGEKYGRQDFPYFESYVRERRRLRTRLRLVAQIDYLNDLTQMSAPSSVGFKLTYKEAALHPGLLTTLTLRRTPVVHLIRSNALDAIVSWEAARNRRIFHLRHGEESPPFAPVRLDASGLAQQLDWREFAVTRMRTRILTLRLPYVEAFYEELVGPRREEKVAGILEFLGLELPPGLLTSNLRRVSDVPTSAAIENFDEVCDALAGTRFEWMLGPQQEHVAGERAFRSSLPAPHSG
jgi:LPS sulfotransferase NodH